MSDDGSSEKVDKEALDTFHFRVVLEDGTGEKEARLCSSCNFVVDEILKTFESTDAKLYHVEDVRIKSPPEDLVSKFNFLNTHTLDKRFATACINTQL